VSGWNCEEALVLGETGERDVGRLGRASVSFRRGLKVVDAQKCVVGQGVLERRRRRWSWRARRTYAKWHGVRDTLQARKRRCVELRGTVPTHGISDADSERGHATVGSGDVRRTKLHAFLKQLRCPFAAPGPKLDGA